MDTAELKKIEEVKRTRLILEIKAVESLSPEEEGMVLNEGYEYRLDGAVPQIADGIAKLAMEMDKDTDMGDKAGGAFIALIQQYYDMLRADTNGAN